MISNWLKWFSGLMSYVGTSGIRIIPVSLGLRLHFLDALSILTSLGCCGVILTNNVIICVQDPPWVVPSFSILFWLKKHPNVLWPLPSAQRSMTLMEHFFRANTITDDAVPCLKLILNVAFGIMALFSLDFSRVHVLHANVFHVCFMSGCAWRVCRNRKKTMFGLPT